MNPAVRHSEYLKYLRELTAIKSPFDSPKDVESCMQLFEMRLRHLLSDYRIWRDAKGNLIAVPIQHVPESPTLILSAHVDTATANSSEWDLPFHPNLVYEDGSQIVCRGVSDCKAGLAFELFLAHLAGSNILELKNVIFTATFKEEGSGEKTATAIGHELGHSIPLSKTNYLLVLENTVSIDKERHISVFVSERSNFAIRISGSLSYISSTLGHLEKWNPVSIRPIQSDSDLQWEVIHQPGGHACSVARAENLLVSIIQQSSDFTVLRAGTEQNFATVPSTIYRGQSQSVIEHICVLANRSYDTKDDVLAQLRDVNFTSIKDFSLSTGFTRSPETEENPLFLALTQNTSRTIPVISDTNPGSSDATIIKSSTRLSPGISLIPYVIGPGTRSQRSVVPTRLTHGKNETYDKESGWICITNILEALTEAGFTSFASKIPDTVEKNHGRGHQT